MTPGTVARSSVLAYGAALRIDRASSGSTPGTPARSVREAALRSKVWTRGRPRYWSNTVVPVRKPGFASQISSVARGSPCRTSAATASTSGASSGKLSR